MQTTASSSKSVKPIIIANLTYIAIQNIIATLKLSKTLKITKRTHEKCYSVIENNIEDNKIIEKLKSANQPHYTFTEAQYHMYALLGHFDLPTDELQEKLKKSEIPEHENQQIVRGSHFLVSFKKKNDRSQWTHLPPQRHRRTDSSLGQTIRAYFDQLHIAISLCETLGACARVSRNQGLPSCVATHTSNSQQCPVFLRQSDEQQIFQTPVFQN